MRFKDLFRRSKKQLLRPTADEEGRRAEKHPGVISKEHLEEALLHNPPPPPAAAAAAPSPAAVTAEPSTAPTIDSSATSLITHTGESVTTSVSSNTHGVLAEHPVHPFHRVDALPHAVADTQQMPPAAGSKASDKAPSYSSEGVPGKVITPLPAELQQRQQQRRFRGDQGNPLQQQQQQQEEEHVPRTKLGLARPLLSDDAKQAAAPAANQAPIAAEVTAGGGAVSADRSPQGMTVKPAGHLTQSTAAAVQPHPTGTHTSKLLDCPLQAAPAAGRSGAAAAAPVSAAAPAVTGNQQSTAATIASALAQIEAAATAKDEEYKRRVRQLQQTEPVAAATAMPAVAAAPAAAGQQGVPLTAPRRTPAGMISAALPPSAGSDQSTHSRSAASAAGGAGRSSDTKDTLAAVEPVFGSIGGSSNSTSGSTSESRGTSVSHNSKTSNRQQQQQSGQMQQQSVMQRVMSGYSTAVNRLDLLVCDAAATATSLLLPLLQKVQAASAADSPGSSSSGYLGGRAGMTCQHEPLAQTLKMMPHRTVKTLDVAACQLVIWITGSLIWGVDQSMSLIDKLPVPEAAAIGSSSSVDSQVQLTRMVRTLPSKTVGTLDLMASEITIWITRSLITVLDLAPAWAQEIIQAFPGWMAAAAAAAASLIGDVLEVLGEGEESTRILDQSISVTHSLLSGDWGSKEHISLTAAAAAASSAAEGEQTAAAAAAASDARLQLEESVVVAHDVEGGDWVVLDPVGTAATAAAATGGVAADVQSQRLLTGQSSSSSYDSTTSADSLTGNSTTAAATATAGRDGPEEAEPSATDSSWELVKQAVPASSSSRRRGLPVTPHPSPSPSLALPQAAAVMPLPLSRVVEYAPGAAAAPVPAGRAAPAAAREDEDVYHDEYSNSSSSGSSSSPATPRPTPSTSVTATAPIHSKQLYQQQLRDAMAAAAAQQQHQQQQHVSRRDTRSSSRSMGPEAAMASTVDQPPEAAGVQQQQQQHGVSGGLPRCNTSLPEKKAAAAAIASAAAMSKNVMQELQMLQQQRQHGHVLTHQPQLSAGTAAGDNNTWARNWIPGQGDVQRDVASRSPDVSGKDTAAPAAAAPAAGPPPAPAAKGDREGVTEPLASWEDVSMVPDTHHPKQQQQQQKGSVQGQQQQGVDRSVGVLLHEAQQQTGRLLDMLNSSGGGASSSGRE